MLGIVISFYRAYELVFMKMTTQGVFMRGGGVFEGLGGYLLDDTPTVGVEPMLPLLDPHDLTQSCEDLITNSSVTTSVHELKSQMCPCWF